MIREGGAGVSGSTGGRERSGDSEGGVKGQRWRGR